ncbi:MAG: signal transduction histidine kinase [Rhodovulum sulfidophilum]|uniref:histidine kinase n=1 Tax=Rhodovulum sulfidophilum TaxID=35806 RepID=A0A2W5PXV6_RHOSU|nr:MAG: signal transduction histidine kinase [Rhodovulum sulfidophilum]
MTGTPPVDLSNCDREPIHVPGSIQPHGCLLACDATATRVLRHSANAPAMLGLTRAPNGMTLGEALGDALAHDVRNALTRAREGARPALLFGQGHEGRRLDISAHRFKGAAILEFEPAEPDVGGPVELTRSMIERLSDAETPEKLIARTARIVQATLGYDRVMVYQFGHDGAGKVVAEAKRAGLESFLGQYFPASDIPAQARTLYLRNTIRVISDADCERVPIVPVLDASGEPLDLSFAHLRSVSPIHCEYLRNMGVGASMSISVIIDGALWGLIACHHYAPRVLSMARRVAAEMFGEFFSLHLSALNQKALLAAATTARAALDQLLRDAAGAGEIGGSLRAGLDDFAGLIRCDGVGMWLDGEWSARGATPPAEFVPELVGFAERAADGAIWATHALSDALPAAAEFADNASGLLIVPLSQRPRDYLFFFRREIVHTLDWAGNPEKTYEVGPLGDRLTPRKSFAIWKETVRRRAAPWSDTERHLAETARVALVEVALRHSELLSDERAKAEVRQRVLNEELNHRVKNILAVIQSLVSQPTDETRALEDYVASLKGRIQALSLAHDQVIRSGGGGSLPRLLEAELAPYRRNAVALSGPAVWLDARAYSILALVLHELATNAAKYGALSTASGRLAVSWELDGAGGCRIVWEETGGPAVSPPARRGFGTLLIDRSVPFDLGGESAIDYRRGGVRAEFRIPPRFVALRDGEAAAPAAADPAPADGVPAGLRVLVVEDQLLIAMELEQILEDLGHEVLATATSPSEALAVLAGARPDVAILDVNLGDATSEPIAEALAGRGVPFLFATGYADGGAIPERFRSVPAVRKPYGPEDVDRGLRRLLARSAAR